MNPLDMIVDRTPAEKILRIEKIRAELVELLRQSVPTTELQSYYAAGWAYVMPDFDTSDHSIVEWLSEKLPVYPTAFNETQTENANGRTAAGTNS